MDTVKICRGCGGTEFSLFVDLGVSPIANSLLEEGQLTEPEVFYPLKPMICERCLLVQLPEVVAPAEMFDRYPYFSSQSRTFVDLAAKYCGEVVDRFHLDRDSLVVEIASNDGYMLQHFMERGVRCYGIEPARNVAEYATKRGIPTLIEFFSAKLVCNLLVESQDEFITGGKADLIIANNVLAHVPNLHSFLHGVRLLLKPEGVFTIEVPWLRNTVDGFQIGQIYHEHLSYFLFYSLQRALFPLRVFDIQRINVHGGSLRVFVCHSEASYEECPAVDFMRAEEELWFHSGDPLGNFSRASANFKREVWSSMSRTGTIGAYAAAAKASTLLNYCGIGTEILPWIADTTAEKQGKYLPGVHIPIVDPQFLADEHPDLVWLLAPNWAKEAIPKIREQSPGSIVMWQEGKEMVYDDPT